MALALFLMVMALLTSLAMAKNMSNHKFCPTPLGPLRVFGSVVDPVPLTCGRSPCKIWLLSSVIPCWHVLESQKFGDTP